MVPSRAAQGLLDLLLKIQGWVKCIYRFLGVSEYKQTATVSLVALTNRSL